MSASGYLWSVPAPTRLAPSAVPAIGEWCRARRRLRPMLVGGSSLTAPPQGLGAVHALEAEGLAVWAFDRAASPAIATVADAVAGYHFENCDCVIAIGGAVAMEVAKAVALMVGQRSPYRLLAVEPGAGGEPVDASGIPALLVVPTTPAAALAVGAAVWIADDSGVARPVRHPALRPGEAILAEDLVAAVPASVQRRSAAVAALVAFDAGVAAAELDALLAGDGGVGGPLRTALRLSSALEGASGPRRRLALTAAVAGGGDFAATLAGLTRPAGWLDEVLGRLAEYRAGESRAGDAGTGSDAGSVLPMDRLALMARVACGPDDARELDRLLAEWGIDPGEVRRRGGRRGRVA